MTFGAGVEPPSGASKTTTAVFVPSDRTAAIRDPSGDHVGKPYMPSEVSSRRVDVPSAATTEIEPSPARTAIEPVDPIGPTDGGTLGSALATSLADGEGGAPEGAALGDGWELAQAAASSAVTVIARTDQALGAIS